MPSRSLAAISSCHVNSALCQLCSLPNAEGWHHLCWLFCGAHSLMGLWGPRDFMYSVGGAGLKSTIMTWMIHTAAISFPMMDESRSCSFLACCRFTMTIQGIILSIAYAMAAFMIRSLYPNEGEATIGRLTGLLVKLCPSEKPEGFAERLKTLLCAD